MAPSSLSVSARFRRGTVAFVVAVSFLLGLASAPTGAVTTPASTLASTWLAAQVGADGQVNISGATQSIVTQTMYVAQGLAATGEHRDALARAMAFLSLGSSIEEWVTNDGSGGTVAPPGDEPAVVLFSAGKPSALLVADGLHAVVARRPRLVTAAP